MGSKIHRCCLKVGGISVMGLEEKGQTDAD
jgi:hypothetical protein